MEAGSMLAVTGGSGGTLSKVEVRSLPIEPALHPGHVQSVRMQTTTED